MADGFVAVDSGALDWRPSSAASGVSVKDLGCSGGFSFQLVRFDPGVRFPEHRHTKPEFIFMLSGTATQHGETLGPGWAGIASAGTNEDDFSSGEGCTFVLVAEE